MNLAIKIISKTLMTKISSISWGGYYKGFYGIQNTFCIAKANQHQSLEKRIFNELVREWILKIQQIMRDSENYNSLKVVILVKMVYRIMRK